MMSHMVTQHLKGNEMQTQKPQIKPTRKETLRREFVCCVKESRAAIRHGEIDYAKEWQDMAARRLSQLGGLAARW